MELQLEIALKRRAPELGIEPGSRLGRVLSERDLNRALTISERDLSAVTGSRDRNQASSEGAMPADREEESNADGAERALEASRAEAAAMREGHLSSRSVAPWRCRVS